MQIRKPDPAEFEAVAGWAFDTNRAQGSQIAYFAEDRALAIKELLEDLPVLQNSFIGEEDGQIVAFMGYEDDPDVGRAWIFGPIVASGDWETAAEELWSAVEGSFPDHVRELELFYDRSSARMDSFSGRHDFIHYKDGDLYRFARQDLDRV